MSKIYRESECLPPVGTVCRFRRIDCLQSPELKDGSEVTIIAHFKSQFGIDVAAFTFDFGSRRYVECATKECFMPIGAVEEREAAIAEMKDIVRLTPLHDCPYHTLYDAGYRKTGATE